MQSSLRRQVKGRPTIIYARRGRTFRDENPRLTVFSSAISLDIGSDSEILLDPPPCATRTGFDVRLLPLNYP